MVKWVVSLLVAAIFAAPVLADAGSVPADGNPDVVTETPLAEMPAEDAHAEVCADGEPALRWLEATRCGLYRATYWLVEGVDGWFGDKPFEESGGEVSGSVYVRGLQREDDGFKTRVRYRVDVTMPNLSERAFVFLGRDVESEVVTDRPETFRRSQLLLPESAEQSSTFFAGVGYFLRENVSVRLGVRGGYKLYSQARYGKEWWLSDRTNLQFTETIFLAVKDGLGSTTELNLGYALTDDTALRWRNAGTFSTKTDGLAWATALGGVRLLPKQREISLDLVAGGETGDVVSTREYGVRGIYRMPVYRDWLLGDLIVGYFWPRDDEDPERREAWALGLAMEMRF